MNLKEWLGSKRFKAALVGVILAVAGKVGLQLDEAALFAIITPILAYIGGQSLSDLSEKKAKAEGEYKLKLADKVNGKET